MMEKRPEDRAATFLHLIRKAQRGRLKVYLGYGPGVGKTYQMLLEGHRLKKDRIDVVIGLVETHGRQDTAALIEGLEVVPRRRAEFHGIAVEELDVDAVKKRRPQVVLVDELAHSNAPGSRNAKRYQDIQELLDAGIHVITTLNVQHLESLYDVVENLLGVKVRERVPDAVLAEADQVVNVDLTTEDLVRRMKDGKVYPKERVQSALSNFFTESNLEHLRELTLRELASQIDLRRREVVQSDRTGPDQLMVCLSSRGPNSARLLRFASRLAGRLNRNWYALYVQTPSEDPTTIDLTTQRLLSDTLTLANQLGATVFTFKGEDVADTILRFAQEYRIGTIVIGKPRRIPWWKRILGRRSVAEQLLQRAQDVAIVVADAEKEGHPPAASAPELDQTAGFLRGGGSRPEPSPDAWSAEQSRPAQARPSTLAGLLSPGRILVFSEPVSRADVLARLASTIVRERPGLDLASVLASIDAREQQGSTFLNEGVALPHGRVFGLEASEAALAVTRGGVTGTGAQSPVQAVFMLLSPANDAGSHLHALATAARVLRDHEVRSELIRAATPAEVLHALAVRPRTHPSDPTNPSAGAQAPR